MPQQPNPIEEKNATLAEAVKYDCTKHPMWAFFRRHAANRVIVEGRLVGGPVEFERDPAPDQRNDAPPEQWRGTHCILKLFIKLARRRGGPHFHGVYSEVTVSAWTYRNPSDMDNAKLGRRIAMWRALNELETVFTAWPWCEGPTTTPAPAPASNRPWCRGHPGSVHEAVQMIPDSMNHVICPVCHTTVALEEPIIKEV